MSMTQRDKSLLLLMPAVAVVMFYAIFFAGGHVRRQWSLTKDRDAARVAAPSSDRLQETQFRTAAAQREFYEVESLNKELKDKWTFVTAPCLGASRRHDRLTRLLDLIVERDLTLLDHASADGPSAGVGAGKMRLSPSLDRLAQQIKERNEVDERPHLWRVRVAGTYAALLGTLQDLGKGEPLAIPVGLDMQETRTGTALREWTLWVWI